MGFDHMVSETPVERFVFRTRDTGYYDGDKTLVVELWLPRVPDDLSGLTFQEWDPSTGTDTIHLIYIGWLRMRIGTPSAYVSIRQHASEVLVKNADRLSFSIRQHTSAAYASMHQQGHSHLPARQG